ncbi:protein kinase domain-containing protein [Neobacillus terrae]|uniref:protein kinase domain-containing protein n=1 Tax=Neobacillus terrae TaxID=3034837 RepID=UPI00140C0F1F|nr:serine/threonine protein kinase [Neobacillus terrae]
MSRTEPHLYHLKGEVGEGGFGRVYKCRDIFSDEDEDLSAIKILKPEQLDHQTLERFQREIRIHSQLKHKNIVPIINFELDDSLPGDDGRGFAYYTMPLAEKNLRDLMSQFRLNNIGRMDDETAVFYFNQILDGVEYAHKAGIIHRDLKPENILVYNELREEVLKISDFGLGKFLNGNTQLTKTHIALGSDVFAAPEQYSDSKEVDERADIFSLGKILYELITYDLPVSIDYDKIASSKLKLIIRKATHSNKYRRFASIQEMRDRINMALGINLALKTSTHQFNIFYNKYNDTGDLTSLWEIITLLNKYNTDYTLYTEHFMNMDEAGIEKMYNSYLEEFYEVVENFLTLIQGGHSYSFTDTIANFVFHNIVPRIQQNIDLYENAFESILKMGYSHNRFYIARLLGDEISKVTSDDHNMIIGEVLSNNPRATRWAKQYFPTSSFCDYLKFVLDSID